MDSNNSSETMQELCKVSESMRQHALKGEWEGLALKDLERRDLFEQLIRLNDPELFKKTRKIQQIFNIDKEVIRLATQAKASTLENQIKFSKGKESCNTYQQIENDNL